MVPSHDPRQLRVAIYIFRFGGFFGTRVLTASAEDVAAGHYPDLSVDDIFDDPLDDDAGWQFVAVVDGPVLGICDTRAGFEVVELSDDGAQSETLARFGYDPARPRSAADAAVAWVQRKVGYVETPVQVTDLTKQ